MVVQLVGVLLAVEQRVGLQLVQRQLLVVPVVGVQLAGAQLVEELSAEEQLVGE